MIDYHQRSETLISTHPSPELGISICIPCYNETEIVDAVHGIYQCTVGYCHCEIIVLINESDIESSEIQAVNHQAYNDLLAYKSKNHRKDVSLHPIYVRNIPAKRAGVGLARKLAMDEAAYRLLSVRGSQKIISCYDADSRCDPNYLCELFSFFSSSPQFDAVSIDYAHPLDQDNREQIINYELHLRYFIEMQRLLHLPFAFHTVGSSMAVRARAYKSEGRMNTKKAGEDFYFLQKFISKKKCGELHSTTIYPSSRVSDRVPFGTGRAISGMLESDDTYTTYNHRSFKVLRSLLDKQKELWKIDKSKVVSVIETIDNQVFVDYLMQIGAVAKIQEIKINTKSYPSFAKRFYQWFDAFQLMKYLHHMRDNGYSQIPIGEASRWLIGHLGQQVENDLVDRLKILRDIQRQTDYGMLVQSRS